MKIYFRDRNTPELAGLSSAERRDVCMRAVQLYQRNRRWLASFPAVIPAVFGVGVGVPAGRYFQNLLPDTYSYLGFFLGPLLAGALAGLATAPLMIQLLRPYFLEARKQLYNTAEQDAAANP